MANSIHDFSGKFHDNSRNFQHFVVMLCDVSYFLKAVQLKVSSWRPTRWVLEVCIGLAQWFVEAWPSLQRHDGIDILSPRQGQLDTFWCGIVLIHRAFSHPSYFVSHFTALVASKRMCSDFFKGPSLLQSAVEMCPPPWKISLQR